MLFDGHPGPPTYTLYVDPPQTNLCRDRIVNFLGFTLLGFTNIVRNVQIDNCIFTTTALSPSMLANCQTAINHDHDVSQI